MNLWWEVLTIGVREITLRRLLILRYVAAIYCGLCFFSGLQASGKQFDPATQDTFIRSVNYIENGEYQSAISLLRNILKQDPTLMRVRLELARAYFLAEEWELARREFFTVLSSKIPDEVRTKILGFLRAIDERRGWSWTLNSAITSGEHGLRKYRSDKVTLNAAGQPLEFEIDRPDPPKYGFRNIGYIEVRETLDPISDSQRNFSVGAEVTFDVLEFSGSDWDDYTVGLNNRLIVTYPETTFEVGPSISYRWFGQEPYEQSWGADARLSNRSVTNWAFTAAGTAQDVDNKLLDDRDGVLIGAEVGGHRSLGGTSIVGMALAGSTFDASAPYESYYEIRLSPYISSDVGYGFTGTLRPSYRIAKYDATAPLFFEPREDWEAGIGLQITKNDHSINGYSPFISYDFAYHDSNIELYQYTNHIFQVGLTKIY